MPRKVSQVVIEADGRDKGKVFVLREMSALRAEKWAARAFLALARGGRPVAEDIIRSGVVGLLSVALDSLHSLSFQEIEPLMDEMFECVQIMPDPAKPHVVRGLIADDVEEVATRLRLRSELLALHTGFTDPAVFSTFPSMTAGRNTGASTMSTSPL